MAQLYVAEVFDSLNLGSMTRAQAHQTLLNVFQLLCWSYLTNAQRTSLITCLNNILLADAMDARTAQDDVTALLQAAIMHDLALFNSICDRYANAQAPRQSDPTMSVRELSPATGR